MNLALEGLQKLPKFSVDGIYCGRGGGYIIATGTQLDDGQEETIRAMVDFTKEYGVYS